GHDRIEILSVAGAALSHSAYIDVPGGPEGVAFDFSHHRAYAHASGDLVAIDVAAREIVDRWATGCGGSHGIPVVDENRGFVFAGCTSRGGGAVLSADDGRLIAGFEAGGGDAILGYSSALGHFYLRGDPGPNVDILGVCDDGSLANLGVATAEN